MSIKVSLVEDNAGIRQSLAEMLRLSTGFLLGNACASAEEALRAIPNNPPDVVLMDINLPRMSGIQCVRELKVCLPHTQFLMVTVEDDSARVFEAIQAGATGYLVKNVPPEQILAAVEEVHRGGAPMSSQIARLVVQAFQARQTAEAESATLTPREREIVGLLARGYRTKEVAAELGITVLTVQTHVRNIYEKLHVRSRAEAVARFLGSG